MSDELECMSECNKCGARYPSAPAGTVHKCGRCSWGYCSPANTRPAPAGDVADLVGRLRRLDIDLSNEGFSDPALAQAADMLEALSRQPAVTGAMVDALWYTTALIAHGMKMSDVFLINGKQRTVEEVWREGKAALSQPAGDKPEQAAAPTGDVVELKRQVSGQSGLIEKYRSLLECFERVIGFDRNGPCPICSGIEGCAHPLPERIRASLANANKGGE